MGCTSCATKKDGIPNGCKSNGTCASGGCDKLSVYDWLGNMSMPSNYQKFNIVEVRFKNGRKAYFKNENDLTIQIGDVIAVEASSGHDIGTITLTGELVKMQLKKYKIGLKSDKILKIYRKASQKDIDIWQEARGKELDVQKKARLMISRHGLKMKLSDVEFQGDGKKATFYYTAEERVDFRVLIRELATTFSIRIEMKQVGLRQEAARLGGIGSCGRELCCSTWLTDFRVVKTEAARYQQLSLNPLKLSGQCGKLKCCLNYELDAYLDTLKDFPRTDTWLHTKQGTAVFQKMDIFSRMLWYTYKDNPMHWHKMSVEQVNEIIALNKENKKPHGLEEYSNELIIEEPKKELYTDLVGQDSLTRFDKPKNKRRKNRKSRNNKNTQNNQNNSSRSNSKQRNNNQNKPNNNQNKTGKNTNPNAKKTNPRNKKPNNNPNAKNNKQNKPNNHQNKKKPSHIKKENSNQK